MTLKNYHSQLTLRMAKITLEENIKEMFELLCTLSSLNYLSYYKYNYEYNDFIYQFSVNNNCDIVIDEETYSRLNKFDFLIKKGGLVLGKVVISNKLKSNLSALKKTFNKIKRDLFKLYEVEKELIGTQSMFNIHLVHDQSLGEFANAMQNGLKGLFNVDIFLETSLNENLVSIKSKDIKHIVIYLISDEDTIVKSQELIKKLNELIIVIGPDDHKLSMLCGKLGIETYIPINQFRAENLKPIILQTRKKLINKNKSNNKIIALCGISGGIGTTTIAMNLASMMAKNMFDKNILYIDLSTTKAVSNLFLEQNPVPEKTIIDLVNSSEYDIAKNLENGLVEIKENFYAITGIQKQIDKEFLEKDVFITKLLDYIKQISSHFNYIIVDIGTADASHLKTTMYDLVNEIWLVTEMTLPHISKLKTFYNLLKRAGLKEKTSFLINRYDSECAISTDDILSILNMEEDEKLHFDFKIKNDYKTLGRAWNYCELACETSKDSVFVKSLEDILVKKHFFTQDIKNEKEKKGILSFLSKGDK
ncbi:AAA family ATPase [Arcobacter sp. FWKO B]|uniref:AAA family ATPase n=1 Tax=Arcobacter sp. FWKO B TaxID=2593672 RepID=UPI0018A4A31E|nr:cellulose synthase operon protein YhjQ/BcsQ [Arcobacter sp. FWKO B]QOG12542.1 AAA family ATPase [Arcobacter sp. FWKO B]